MYDCVIFDVDGTLIDTEKMIIKALQKVLQEELKHQYNYDELTFVLGIPGAGSLEKLGVKNVEGACQKWDLYMREYGEQIKVYPGIKSVLEDLSKRGIKTGIVTSKTKEQFKNDFLPLGLAEYLEYVVCADDTARHKPDPDPLLKFLELAQVSAEKAIYVGDTIYDMRCARGAGLDFALALWGARITEGIAAKYNLEKPEDILNTLIR